jgi:hypothetical protein
VRYSPSTGSSYAWCATSTVAEIAITIKLPLKRSRSLHHISLRPPGGLQDPHQLHRDARGEAVGVGVADDEPGIGAKACLLAEGEVDVRPAFARNSAGLRMTALPAS